MSNFVSASDPPPSGSATSQNRKRKIPVFQQIRRQLLPALAPLYSSSTTITNVATLIWYDYCILVFPHSSHFAFSERGKYSTSCETEAEHVAVVSLLKQNSLQSHTFSNQKDAHAKLVIKALDLYSDPAEVADEHYQLGFKIKGAIRSSLSAVLEGPYSSDKCNTSQGMGCGSTVGGDQFVQHQDLNKKKPRN